MEFNLFEYENRVEYAGDIEKLENLLDEIWANRPLYNTGNDEDDRIAKSKTQRFLSVIRRSGKTHIASKNYVGVIKTEHETINLLPKIFFDEYQCVGTEREVLSSVNRSILWWLGYSSRIKFPNTKSDLSFLENDFFESLVYVFSDFTRKTLNSYLYLYYVENEGELSTIKGRINVSCYLGNIARGNMHKVPCVYESFEVDNRFNRIIKYVAKILHAVTRSEENRNNLSEIIWLLDEVSDCNINYSECEKVKINSMFDEYQIILDYCKLFLNNSISHYDNNELKLFALLLPMEVVYEDFICNFISKCIMKRKNQGFSEPRLQRSDKYLAEAKLGDTVRNVFMMQHDLMFRHNGIPIILDTKYKQIYRNENELEDDFKGDVSQSDLYQQISYAIRQKSNVAFLVYPLRSSESPSGKKQQLCFKVKDMFSEQYIHVHIVKVPIKYYINNEQSERKLEEYLFDEQDGVICEALAQPII